MEATGQTLPLTGERTVPGIERENYWFRRHEAAYLWLIETPGLLEGPDGVSANVILEAGAGEGYGAALMADHGVSVIALELDELAAAHMHRRYPEVHTVLANLGAVDASGDRRGGMPVRTAGVNAVVSMQVIEHLWDLPGFLDDCARVLRPGGLLVLSTPNRLTFSPGLGRGERPVNPFHVEEFDAEQLAALARARAGIHDVRVVGLHHGARLTSQDLADGSLVAAQVAAVLAEASDGTPWPAELERRVAAVEVGDFEVLDDPSRLDAALDLILGAHVD